MIKRRSFLAGVGVALTPQVVGETRWQPARHEQDDWLDKIPGKHRFIFDTIVPEGFANALAFANNFYIANQNAYGLKESDLAVVLVARHFSTVLAWNDAMWVKYGASISQQVNFVDPKTKEAPKNNVHMGAIEGLIKRGAHFAVCQMATRVFAGRIARAVGVEADAVYNELAANLVGNSHLVAAGIVAVNRAQERGYTFVHA